MLRMSTKYTGVLKIKYLAQPNMTNAQWLFHTCYYTVEPDQNIFSLVLIAANFLQGLSGTLSNRRFSRSGLDEFSVGPLSTQINHCLFCKTHKYISFNIIT